MNAAADGYTLLMVVPANAINALIYTSLNFNFIRDMVPIAAFMRVPLVMEVNPSFPAETVPDLIVYAKSRPGTINMASAGIGSSGHVAGELFKMMAGVDLLHVPYRGGAPAIADLLGGRVQLLFDPVNSSTEYINAGKLRALAVTATRSKALPDVPVVGDFVPGFEASAIYGLAGPRNMPAELIERLNKEVNAALIDPEMKVWLTDQGGAPSRLACRFPPDHRQGNREVGQRRPGGRYQANRLTRKPWRFVPREVALKKPEQQRRTAPINTGRNGAEAQGLANQA